MPLDKETFVRLMEGKTDALYRVAWAILGNDADAADAMQETALRAWKHRDSLRNQAYFGTWVVRICINVSRRMLRKRRPHVALSDVQSAAPPPDLTLSLALQALPEPLRLPLLLHAAQGMSYQEIAYALHLPESTVRGRIARAKQALRKELDAQ